MGSVTYDTHQGVFKFTSAPMAITGERYPEHFYWVNKRGGAGSDLKVQDTASNNLWEAVASASNYHELYEIGRKVTGIVATTLDSGTLYVIMSPDGGHHYGHR